ncbi:MAG: NosD domain-containing protein, partial [Rhodanobacter sp.]
MGKKRPCRFTREVLLLAGIAGLIPGAGMRAETITVTAGTIQAAVDSANPGDVVAVPAGTYSENIILGDDDISIVGAGSADTIIVGGIRTGNRDNIAISHLTISGGHDWGSDGNDDPGIWLEQGTSGHSLSNLVISGPGNNTARGILFTINGVQDVAVTDVEVYGWRTGVYINPGSSDVVFTRYTGGAGGNIAIDGPLSDVIIDDSDFVDSGIGMSDYQSPPGPGSMQITNTRFSGTGPSLSFWDSQASGWANDPITIQDSVFTSDVPLKLNASPGYVVPLPTTSVISGLFFANRNNTVTLSPNSFVDGSIAPIAAGVLLAGEDGTVEVSAGAYAGAVEITSPNLTINGQPGAVISVVSAPNQVPDATGISVQAAGVTIQGLEFVGPHVTHFSEVDWNDPAANTTGVWLRNAPQANVTGNTIRNVRTGVQIDNTATDVVITGNVIDNTKGSFLQRSTAVAFDGNSAGANGNEWDLVILVGPLASPPAATSPTAITTLPLQQDGLAAYATSMLAVSASNGGMRVLDRRFSAANRSHIHVRPGANPGPTDDFNLGTGLGNARQPFGSIQHALTGVVAGGSLLIDAGTYVENLVIDKAIALNGNNRTVNLLGHITITAPEVSVTALAISNPTGSHGIQVKAASNITLHDNALSGIGTASSGSAQAIYVLQGSSAFSGITITDNDISDVGHTGSSVSTKGIYLGDSTAAHSLANVNISGNSIRNVTTADNKGAYGILVNYGFNGAGAVDGLTISDNTINGLMGGWVHGIGLETDTANTAVTLNTIDTLEAAGTDAAAV